MARKTAQPSPDATGPADTAPSPLPSATIATPKEIVRASPESASATEPVPLEVPLEEQIAQLPSLVYPSSSNQEFERWAGKKRRGRLQLEVVGAAILLIVGVVATIFSGLPAFIAVALFGIAGLGAYEFLVTSFE